MLFIMFLFFSGLCLLKSDKDIGLSFPRLFNILALRTAFLNLSTAVLRAPYPSPIINLFAFSFLKIPTGGGCAIGFIKVVGV